MVSVLLAVTLSCAPKKRMVSTAGGERRVSRVERMDILDNISQRQLRFSTFSGRAKSSVTINKEYYDATANVRIERDKAIWISITALMGIEMGRLLITEDSVKIINRLRSEYTRKPFSYLSDLTGAALDFSTLQQLLVGNAIDQATGSDTEVWAVGDGYVLRSETPGLAYLVQLDTNYRTVRTLMEKQTQHQRMETNYMDYRESSGFTFPHLVSISLTADRLDLRSEMKYSKVSYNDALEMPFNIPPRYTESQ